MIVVAAVGLSACGFGKNSIDVPAETPAHEGAELFATHCSACHTMEPAGTQGTGNRGTRVQGPDLDQRHTPYEDALYAIENGGFSGAIMPQNIVVGEDAELVAQFIDEYSGTIMDDDPAATERIGP